MKTGKQLASSRRGGQTIVKQWSNNSQTIVRGEAKGLDRGICEENTRGEFATFGRWIICSLRITENLQEDPSGDE